MKVFNLKHSFYKPSVSLWSGLPLTGSKCSLPFSHHFHLFFSSIFPSLLSLILLWLSLSVGDVMTTHLVMRKTGELLHMFVCTDWNIWNQVIRSRFAHRWYLPCYGFAMLNQLKCYIQLFTCAYLFFLSYVSHCATTAVSCALVSVYTDLNNVWMWMLKPLNGSSTSKIHESNKSMGLEQSHKDLFPNS